MMKAAVDEEYGRHSIYAWFGNSMMFITEQLSNVPDRAMAACRYVDCTSSKLAILVITFTTCWILNSQWSKHANRIDSDTSPLVPGDMGLPIIGSIWSTYKFLFTMRSSRDVRDFFAKCVSKYGPVFKFNLLGQAIVIFDNPAGTKFIFQNEFSLVAISYPNPTKRLLGKDSILVASGQKHRNLRGLLKEFFSTHALGQSVTKLESIILQDLKDSWEGREGEELSAHDRLSKLTFTLIVDQLLSLTEKSTIERLRSLFKIWASGLLTVPINLPGFQFHRSLKAKAEIQKFLDERIAMRRQELQDGLATPNQDVLSVMLTTQDEEGNLCTEDYIKDNVMILVYGGEDTTACTMSTLLRHIAENPRVYDGLMAERSIISESKKNNLLTMKDLLSMDYTWRTVQESMRIVPVFNLGFREALKEFEYNGVRILKGWKVVWSRAREMYENHDHFDPSRFEKAMPPYTFNPFGGGRHLCPGNEYARMQIVLFLYHFLGKFKWSMVDPNERMIFNPMPVHVNGNLITIAKVSS